jgi:homoserine dehydrogenase
MLSAMGATGAEYEDVLKEAQRLGYAEADPTEDVGGKDAAAKMAILSSIAFHSRTRLADVQYEGIMNVTALDIAHGKRLGLVAKLLGVAKLVDGGMNVRVYPAFLPHTHPLAGVSGAYNAVFLESDTFDEIMLFGPGAGSVPTASAVIGDIISIVNTAPGSYVRNCQCYRDLPFFPDADMVSRFYLRLRVDDQPGVLARISALFGDEGVSIESMVQEGRGDEAELVLVLHPVREAQFFAALNRIRELSVVAGEPSVIRVEGEA